MKPAGPVPTTRSARWIAALRYRAALAAYRAARPLLSRRAAVVAGRRLPSAPLRIEPLRDWIFHDETWPRVVGRFADRLRVQQGLAVEADDAPQDPGGHVRMGPVAPAALYVPPGSDRWLYLHLDPDRHPWTDYRWTFSVRRLTDFRELQFAFRYRDFYNRYRYRFEDGCLHFDVVHRGRFYGSLSRVPCPLEPGAWHVVEIDVVGRSFCCRVDGRLVSSDLDPANLFPRGPVAVILWEDDGRTAIGAEMRDVSVVALGPP